MRFQGSGDYLKSFTQRAKRDLDSGGLIAVVGPLDRYCAPLPFPPDSTTDAKCAFAKAELKHRVGHPRFRQHFAVHETAAWLLSDPSIVPAPLRTRVEKLGDRPESIDFQEPPAKLLHRLYRDAGRDYKKVTDGSASFAQLDPEVAYARCPHLSVLLNDMLSLANAVG